MTFKIMLQKVLQSKLTVGNHPILWQSPANFHLFLRVDSHCCETVSIKIILSIAGLI